MKTLQKTIIPLAVLFLMSSMVLVAAYNLNIDPNYAIKFSTTAASGTFSNLKGQVVFSADDLAQSKIDVTVDASTINTGIGLKDSHAKDEDWLNVQKYPLIRFKSSAFTKDKDQYIMDGSLELHGVTKNIKIPFAYSMLKDKGIFSGSFEINREDYGIKGSGLKAKIVGSKIKITFNVPTTKAA